MAELDVSLKEVDWQAKWIWHDGTLNTNDFAFLRKEIVVKGPVSNAWIHVSAHNHFVLYINGKKASGYVTPAPTHPKKSKYYLSYDATALLKAGTNAVCAVAHYIGGGGQNYADGLPGFILQCEVTYTDQTKQIYITDQTWKTAADTPYRSGTAFQQNRRISAIIDYDARKENNAWLESGFDDAGWKTACLSSVNNEGWVLKQQSIPEGVIHEIITPVPSGVQEKGLQVFDAGRIVTGWPRLILPGIKGAQVQTRYSEDLDETGRVRHKVANEDSENYYDRYTMRGSESETWEPDISYKAFRYVEVTGYPELITPGNIKIISAGTGITYKGFFNSSNLLLNDIYKACIYTQINNVTGQMVDCPHREQAQYLADSDWQAETFTYSFTDRSVPVKVLLDFKDAQYEDGTFPFVFPTNVDNRDFMVKIPEWDLHFITLLWKIYFIYDDRETLAFCYEACKKTVNHYLDLRSGPTGLVPKAAGFPEGWNISDWPYPDIDHSGEYLTVQNCFLFHVTGLMSEIASVLGFYDDKEKYDLQADALKEAIVRHLYNPDLKLFADSYGSSGRHQGTNVVAYQSGLVPYEDREAVLGFITAEGFGTSTLLSLYLLRVLFENGKCREAYNLINRTEQPGWGSMISKGYKTVWEGFRDTESHSHAWNAYPARILTEYLAGIKAASPGFGEIVIKPFMPEGLQFVEAVVPTVRGDICVFWEKCESGFVLKSDIPAGSTAKIYLSSTVSGKSCGHTGHKAEAMASCSIKQIIWDGCLIFTDGGPCASEGTIRYGGQEDGFVIFLTGGGNHRFDVTCEL